MRAFRTLPLWVYVVVMACIAGLLWWRSHTSVPFLWDDTGTLVFMFRASPSDATISQAISVSSISLLRNNESTVHLPLVTRRILLDPTTNAFSIAVQTKILAGMYDGYTVSLAGIEMVGTTSSAIALTYPSFTIPISFDVIPDATSTLLISVDLVPPRYVGVENTSLFLPTLTTEIRSGATVTVSHDIVQCEGGVLHTSELYGMDRNGRMRHNYREVDVEDDSVAQE